MDVEYEWLSGKIKNIDPNKAAAYLERLKQENKGTLGKQQIVDAARDPESLLHSCFTWDDELAGEKFRLQEAGELVRELRIKVSQPIEVTASTCKISYAPPAYKNVSPEGQKANYHSVKNIASNEVAQQIIIRKLNNRIDALIREVDEFPIVMRLLKDAKDALPS